MPDSANANSRLIFGFIEPKIGFGTLITVAGFCIVFWGGVQTDKQRLDNLAKTMEAIQASQAQVQIWQSTTQQNQALENFTVTEHTSRLTGLETAMGLVTNKEEQNRQDLVREKEVYDERFNNINKNLAVLNEASHSPLLPPRGRN